MKSLSTTRLVILKNQTRGSPFLLLDLTVGLILSQEISRPLTWHRFGSPDAGDVEDDAGSYFISAVCWKSDSPTILTANSQGTIKVLVLAV